jgi:hypothetical protein
MIEFGILIVFLVVVDWLIKQDRKAYYQRHPDQQEYCRQYHHHDYPGDWW